MTFVGTEHKNVFSRSTTKLNKKLFLKYECPKPGCVTPIVSFLDKTGFNNPYQHLKSCYARGQSATQQQAVLRALYAEAQSTADRLGGSLKSHFRIDTLSEYEKTVNSYIRLIVLKSLPISYVDDNEIRSFSKFNMVVISKTIIQVIFQLVKLVESRIKDEIHDTKGAILYDGWTCNSTHYIGLYASYCVPQPHRYSNANITRAVHRLTLLSLSPMSQESSDETKEGRSEETTVFNAQAHIDFFREIFLFYRQYFDTWCMCLIGHNTSTNLKIARVLENPHVGCNSHKLALEVNLMMKNHFDLTRVIDAVHETMRTAKIKLRNAALLRNLTDLRPIMNNETRWSGKVLMLKRFLRIREELIEASNDLHGDIPINISSSFTSQTRKYQAMLSEIDVVTARWQTYGITLKHCRGALDTLIDAVEEERGINRPALWMQAGRPLYFTNSKYRYKSDI